MRLRRLAAAAALVISAAILPVGASLADSRPLRVGEIWEITSLDPAINGTLMKEKSLVVETLVQGLPDFSIAPMLAESWEWIGDLTWEFRIRPGVVFHDGEPLTAEAVKDSLEYSLGASPVVRSYTLIDSIEIAGDMLLKITTTQPHPALPASLAYSGAAIISMNSPRTSTGGIERPIGTGPFQVSEWRPADHSFTAVRNDDYWGNAPSIPAIEFRGIPDPATRSLEMQKGDIDFTAEVPYGDLDMLEAQGFTVSRNVTARIYALTFGDIVDSHFSDIRVRQAISAAIDREAISEYVLFGMAQPAKGPFDPAMVFANRDLEAPVYDPERARSLLAEAGYMIGEDGIARKDGQPLSFTLYTYPQRPGLIPMGEAIQGALREIGVDVKVRVESYASIAQNMGPGDARLAAFATTMFPDPDFFLRIMYASDGVNNVWGYNSPEIDAALELAQTTRSEEERQAAYDQVQALGVADQPFIYVAYYGVNVVMKPGVGNYTFNPIAHDYMLDPEMTLVD